MAADESTVATETADDRPSARGRDGRSARASSCRTGWTRPPSSPSIERVRHPKYNKFVLQTKKLYAHDETNDVNVGDKVRVMETRPLSKNKRWRVVEVLERAK